MTTVVRANDIHGREAIVTMHGAVGERRLTISVYIPGEQLQHQTLLQFQGMVQAVDGLDEALAGDGTNDGEATPEDERSGSVVSVGASDNVVVEEGSDGGMVEAVDGLDEALAEDGTNDGEATPDAERSGSVVSMWPEEVFSPVMCEICGVLPASEMYYPECETCWHEH